MSLKFDKNGKFRQFAFIGYKSASDANEAIGHFNKTYIEKAKVSVELYSDKPVVRGKREETATEPEESKSPKKEKHNPFDELKDDPSFAEFLKVQRNIGTNPKHVWGDDIVVNEGKNVEHDSGNDSDDSILADVIEKPSSTKKAKVTPSEVYEFTIKVKGLPYKCKKAQVKEFFKPLKPISLRLPTQIKGIAFISFKTEKEFSQALNKHRSFLEGHRIEVQKHKKVPQDNAPSALPATDNGNQTKNKKTKKEYKIPSETIADTGRMFLRNLSYTCTVADLEDLFGKYGQLSEVHLPLDSYTKKIKGFAFITFMFPEHAVKAFSELDKTPFQGRLLHLIPAHAKPDGKEEPSFVDDKSAFKKQKESDKKRGAQKSQNWNTLFLGANAVAEVMSEKYNIKKSQLLADADAKDSVAVRMALGETQLVNETKQFLIDNGVDLDALNEAESQRSKTTFLVKHLPYRTTAQEIEDLFAQHGFVQRVLLPAFGITAIVEMQEQSEALSAFKKLAYSNFKHFPLYLEWAPVNLLGKKASTAKTGAEAGDGGNKRTPGAQQEPLSATQNDGAGAGDANEGEARQEPGQEKTPEGCSLFIKNVSFETGDEDFERHFAKCGQLISASVARRHDGARSLSMGYGFVCYKQRAAAEKALKELQNSSLDGHCLQVSLSRGVKT